MLRRIVLGGILGLLVLAPVCAFAQAQPAEGGRRPGGFGGGFGGGFSGATEGMLLGNEKVQKELELLPEQVADLTKHREATQSQMREMFSGMRDLPEDERRKKFEEIRGKLETAQKESREKVNAVLLPHQQDRLKEISLQLRGFGAIDDPEVAAALKISDEQKEKIAAVRTEQREKMGELFRQGGQDQDRDAMREKFQKLRTENEKQVLDVLTTAQQAQFEKMKGEKFELDMSALGAGGRGGPGGGGTRFGGRRPEGNPPAPNSNDK